MGYTLQLHSDRKKEMGKRFALRMLLKIEIRNNNQNLKKLYNNILKHSGSDNANILAEILTMKDSLVINNPLWADKTTLLAQSLNEDEINSIECYYKSLNKCSELQREITNLREIEEENKNSNIRMNNDKKYIFTLKAPKKWKSFRNLYSLTIENGDSIIYKLENSKKYVGLKL